MVLIRKNGLWRVYAARWVGLGLWGRCVSYVSENCVSYTRQQISYHIHAKTEYYMHAKHVRIICSLRQSQFLHINTTSFRFYLAYYLYAFSCDRAVTNFIGLFKKKKTVILLMYTIVWKFRLRTKYFYSTKLIKSDSKDLKKNVKQHNSVFNIDNNNNNKCLFAPNQHITLKTRIMATENSAFHLRNK